MHPDTSGGGRMPMWQWMEHLIESGKCPGLTWVNRSEKIFTIPWFKYKKDVEKRHQPIVFKVFLEYAKFSKKFKDGDVPNYPEFKHNLRCALRKMENHFELIENNSSEKFNPHKVYRLRPPSISHAPRDEQLYHNCPGQANAATHLQASNIPLCYEGLESDNQLYNLSARCSGGNHSLMDSSETLIAQSKQPFLITPQQNPFPLNKLSGNACSEKANVSEDIQEHGSNVPVHILGVSFPESDTCGGNENLEVPVSNDFPSDLCSIDENDLVSLQHALPFQVMSPGSSTSFADAAEAIHNTVVRDSEHTMTLEVFYGEPKVLMLKRIVRENGCRLYSGDREMANTLCCAPLKDLTEIELPKPHFENCDAEARQTPLISQILNKMDRGLDLTIKDGDIYAERQCVTKVFASDAHFNNQELKRKLPSPVKVFDFHDFQRKLESLQGSGAGTSEGLPPAFFRLIFGARAKITDQVNPLRHVLFHIIVQHNKAVDMLNDFITKNKRTDGSIEPLKSSNLDSTDCLIEHFKEMKA